MDRNTAVCYTMSALSGTFGLYELLNSGGRTNYHFYIGVEFSLGAAIFGLLGKVIQMSKSDGKYNLKIE